ncbi:peptidoglycan-binding domain-containing protein [Thalassorhabdomicrobium marinisediminis]|uniref:Peptidoglycan binding-like domain-containing protein n=1 Tax=Thalassorhabdomicrobium marinisediminis TaxID=2170577 RepID=A0A2T7FUY9_9RHOB|nr:peptidoglycan-binding domain-containing protein [Thalassorhabdomicrobium marinisediminis]PVA05978.1 hypothetical protein DC363_11710 [Thalassorhabdomicrobium marinisediminis]
MINRRNILISAPAALLCAHAATAQSAGVTVEEVRAVFEQRDRGTRMMAQRGLQGEGYYTGPIDGAWGPGTAEAYRKLIASPRYQRHASGWTWSREAQVIDTLLFLNSDAFL